MNEIAVCEWNLLNIPTKTCLKQINIYFLDPVGSNQDKYVLNPFFCPVSLWWQLFILAWYCSILRPNPGIFNWNRRCFHDLFTHQGMICVFFSFLKHILAPTTLSDCSKDYLTIFFFFFLKKIITKLMMNTQN